jgi:hypothetical protein
MVSQVDAAGLRLTMADVFHSSKLFDMDSSGAKEKTGEIGEIGETGELGDIGGETGDSCRWKRRYCVFWSVEGGTKQRGCIITW